MNLRNLTLGGLLATTAVARVGERSNAATYFPDAVKVICDGKRPNISALPTVDIGTPPFPNHQQVALWQDYFDRNTNTSSVSQVNDCLSPGKTAKLPNGFIDQQTENCVVDSIVSIAAPNSGKLNQMSIKNVTDDCAAAKALAENQLGKAPEYNQSPFFNSTGKCIIQPSSKEEAYKKITGDFCGSGTPAKPGPSQPSSAKKGGRVGKNGAIANQRRVPSKKARARMTWSNKKTTTK